jgi:hypothetical protein
MEHQSENEKQTITTATEVQGYQLNDHEANKQALEDPKELRDEELQAVTGSAIFTPRVLGIGGAATVIVGLGLGLGLGFGLRHHHDSGGDSGGSGSGGGIGSGGGDGGGGGG